MDTIKLLNTYINGNVKVSIYSDGTKIQEWSDDETPNPIYPNSMDIKITNKCDLGCPFCHEMSVPNGDHADLNKLINLLKDLPAGTELAIGGGNPLAHCDLDLFLSKCKELQFIPSITVNGKHLYDNYNYINQLNNLIDNNLVYGIGISIADDFDFSILSKIHKLDNIVFHVIAGVNNITILDKIKESLVKKVLILGYKPFGRGLNFHDSLLLNLLSWERGIEYYLGKLHISFDNLAITQLNIKNIFPEDIWKRLYMGDDGQFTMYIDAVNWEYSISSTKEKYKILPEVTIKTIFSYVRERSAIIERAVYNFTQQNL